MVVKFNALIAAVLALGLLTGCGPRVQNQDALEFNYPAIRKARAKLREGDKRAALELLDRAIADKPALAQAHLEIAQLFDDYERDYVRAVYHYQRYLELRPQTEKREMIEGFIRKAKIAFAGSIAEQVPGLDKKVQSLQEENDRLKQDLRQVRSNLARRIAAGSETASPAVPSVAPAAGAGAAVRPETAGQPAGGQYRVQPGDTLSSVAARAYQNPRQWKKIYDANRELLGGSQKLKVGQVLVIPR